MERIKENLIALSEIVIVAVVLAVITGGFFGIAFRVSCLFVNCKG